MATTKKAAAKKSTGKRQLIAPKGDKRFVRRNEKGQIMESDDVGRSLSSDRKRSASTAAKPGQGDKGDRQTKKAAPKKSAAKKSAPKKSAGKKAAPKKAAPKKSAAKKSTSKKSAPKRKR